MVKIKKNTLYSYYFVYFQLWYQIKRIIFDLHYLHFSNPAFTQYSASHNTVVLLHESKQSCDVVEHAYIRLNANDFNNKHE